MAPNWLKKTKHQGRFTIILLWQHRIDLDLINIISQSGNSLVFGSKISLWQPSHFCLSERPIKGHQKMRSVSGRLKVDDDIQLKKLHRCKDNEGRKAWGLMKVLQNGDDASAGVFAEKTSGPQICPSAACSEMYPIHQPWGPPVSFWATGGGSASIQICGVVAKCPSGSFSVETFNCV